jgi:hypothetical protein
MKAEPKKSLIELEPEGLEFFLETPEYLALARKVDGLKATALVLRQTDHGRELARELKANCDRLVVLSDAPGQLAWRVLLDCLQFAESVPTLLVGTGIDQGQLASAIELCEDQSLRVGLVVISHGPATPILATDFALLEQAMATRYARPELQRRIVLLCDAAGEKAGYRHVPLEADGSLLAGPVALFALSLANQDPEQFCEGLRSESRSSSHPRAVYASLRILLKRDLGAHESILVLGPTQHSLGQWLERLHPGSSTSDLTLPVVGKVFEVSVRHRDCSSDLHEICESLLEQALQGREVVGRLSLRIPRLDLFSLGALVAFFLGAEAIGRRLALEP